MRKVLAALGAVMAFAIVADDASMKDAYDRMPAEERSDDDGNYKPYEQGGYKFKVREPSDGTMAIEGEDGLGSGSVSVNDNRRVFIYRSPEGSSVDEVPEHAFQSVIKGLITAAKRPPADQLRKRLDEFYESLPAKGGE